MAAPREPVSRLHTGQLGEQSAAEPRRPGDDGPCQGRDLAAVVHIEGQRTVSSAECAPPRWRHVIFDLDGTLADTVADIAAALNHALREHGYASLPLPRVQQIVGEGARRLVEQALPEANAAAHERVLATFLEFYRAHAVDRTRTYAGIPELLQALQDCGVTSTVLTNKPESLGRTIVQRLGLMPYLRALCGGDTLPQRKPDPAGVRYLCARVARGVGDTLVVGDSGVDRATAAAAGAAFCAALWGYRPEDIRDAPLVAATPAALQHVVLAPDGFCCKRER